MVYEERYNKIKISMLTNQHIMNTKFEREKKRILWDTLYVTFLWDTPYVTFLWDTPYVTFLWDTPYVTFLYFCFNRKEYYH